MIRKAFVMGIHPESHEEYHRRHAQLWPELAAVLKSHGVRQYSIFLLAETNQLFACAEIEDEALWNGIARTEACRKWWDFMKDIMPTNPDNSPVSVPLTEVFHLAQ